MALESGGAMPGRRARALGYAFAIGAGVLWGTTGPLSTALYSEGAALTGVGFWRIAVATLALAVVALFRRDLLRVDRRGLWTVGLGGGALVAVFEVAYQYAIAGVGVAGAATLLYTAPLLVAVLAFLVLGERLTPLRVALAVVVLIGVYLTVQGGAGVESLFVSREAGVAAGVAGGLLAALAYAGTTLLARWAVPRYGATRVLFLELAGGTLLLALLLPAAGRPPAPPDTVSAWIYIGLLSIGAVLGANYLFFSALKRIEAAPTAVAATIEPVVAAVLALVLFGQTLSGGGWSGLALVVAGVAVGYLAEARADRSDGPG
ncbi:MAG: DMT family transporter [marine benthic group bacterium]|nr:DMT family transporter [Candidatus Benthicola marisminoris]